ncbi:(2,3-dihydroxybenzoyl)adenylate synthase [Paracoccus jiaweipingae]|uniref:(2,3-dihydroxybenzoyl)adenylate synthase n=1 Tax=unclassified Paracoccus (in: a-proteobacteria) TaxID=2688777 RepID=UPI0037B8740B
MTPQQIWPKDRAERYRAAGYWRGETFSQMLAARAQAHPDRIAVTGPDGSFSYGALADRAGRMAARFRAAGLEPGQRVIVQLPNLADMVTVVFGLFHAGLIPVFALPAHRRAEITHFRDKAQASALVIPGQHGGFDYRELARDCGIAQVFVPGDPGPDQAGGPAFHDLRDLSDAAPPAYPADAGQVAFLQISGGSTGLSKLIPRSHDDYLYSVRASARICGLDDSAVYLTALPAAHNFPMSSPGWLGAIWAGGHVVMAPDPNPATCFALIARHRVTITGLVPPLALVWADAAARGHADLSSLRLLQVGGAKLTAQAAARLLPAFGGRLQQVFGMAEGLVNYTRPDDPEQIVLTTQGRPISPDDELRVVDDHDRPVPDGQTGHLLTRGPYTINAYHNDPAANARSFTEDGFYRTGDMVRLLPGGYVQVQGRATDHINRAGEKVSAEEVEDHLIAHPDVFDAAVVALPDAFLGERACAVIVPRGPAPRPADLRAFLRDRGIAGFKIPDQFSFTEGFQTTAVGKTSRKALRAALRDSLMQKE